MAWGHEAPAQVRHPIAYPKYPHMHFPDSAKGRLLAKGEYLVKAGDCIACHTNYKEGGRSFAGGEGIKTPFGSVFPPNITPDNATGIGKWTEQQFIRALREGVAANGSFLYPVFPYPYYNLISDDDAKAIYAYMRQVPAVHQANHPNDMMFPFNWRFLQLGWRMLFFYPHRGVYKADPKQSAQWNRGAYLVKSLTHCSMCHTPINLLGAPKSKYYLAGSNVTGMYAPDITARGLKPYTDEQIMNVFLHGKRLSGEGELMGPMKEADEDSFKYLTKNDLKSIIVYLRTVQSASPPKPSGSGKGEAIYQQYCTGCHTTGAGGAPKFGDANAWAPYLKQGKDNVYNNAIHGYGNMPAKGNCTTCSDQDIHAAVDYILGSVATSAPSQSKYPKGPKPKQLSMSDGKRIYNESTCHLCHNNGQMGAPRIGDAHAWRGRISQGMDKLFRHAIQGYGHMPARGGCVTCSDAEIIAATKYMVQQSSKGGNYDLW